MFDAMKFWCHSSRLAALTVAAILGWSSAVASQEWTVTSELDAAGNRTHEVWDHGTDGWSDWACVYEPACTAPFENCQRFERCDPAPYAAEVPDYYCDLDVLAETVQRGRDTFAAGDFAVAAREMMRTYSCARQDVVQYNIGRCYQELGRCYSAFSWFQMYLSTGDSSASTQAQTHMEAIRACADSFGTALETGRVQWQAGDLEGALDTVKAALERLPNGVFEPAGAMMAIELLAELGRPDEARGLAAQAGLSDWLPAEVQLALEGSGAVVVVVPDLPESVAIPEGTGDSTALVMGDGSTFPPIDQPAEPSPLGTDVYREATYEELLVAADTETATGNLSMAVGLRLQAYGMRGDPPLLFQVGTSLEELDRCFAAHRVYERYLATEDGRHRTDAEAALARVSSCATAFQTELDVARDALALGEQLTALGASERALRNSWEPEIVLILAEVHLANGLCQAAGGAIDQALLRPDLDAGSRSSLRALRQRVTESCE